MRQSMGEISTLNIIIIFIIIVFGLLSASLNYYKAYKLNTRILDIVQKYEGYNNFSREAITNDLNSFGYVKNPGNDFCKKTIGTGNKALTLVGTGDNKSQIARNITLGDGGTNIPSHYYCLYYVPDDSKGKTKTNKEPLYYNYVVFTYIFVDLPIVGQFKIPVRTKGERVYNFSNGKNPLTE